MSVDTSKSELHARLAAARADAQTSAAADDYGQFLVARYASLINDPEEAAQKYAQVARSRPDDESLMERAVFSALLADEFALAESIARRASDTVMVGTSLPRLTLAADAFARGDTMKVASLLEGEDAGPFNRLIMSSLRAWALFDLDQVDRAQLTLLDASSGDPYLDSIMLNLLALMEVAAGEDEDALQTFARLDTNDTLIASAATSYARLLVHEGRTTEAIVMLDRFRRAAGHNPSVARLLEQIEAGQPVGVERLTPRQGAALSIYVPAAALASQTQTDLPGVYYSLALRLDPQLHAARALWADALDKAGRSQDSVAMLETIPASSPYYVSARGQLAWALRRGQRNQEALKLVYATLAGDPDRDLKIQMGDLLRSLGHDGEAVKVFTEIISADEAANDRDWRLYFARGAARERLGQWPLAEEDLRTALALNPQSADVMNYLGYSWVDRGLYLEEGLDLIRKALTLRPESGAITDSLGWAHYKIGNYETAVGYLERAVELEPGVTAINDHLGDAYWMAGRQLEARFQWQRAISLMEDEAEIERVQRKMLTGPAQATVAAQHP